MTQISYLSVTPGKALFTASMIGGTSISKKSISEINVHRNVLKAPTTGIGETSLIPGIVKN